MISMLIYSCKQDEIELLREISRDTVADLFDEQLEIFVVDVQKTEDIYKIDSMDLAFVDITDESGLRVAKELRNHFPKIELMIISDNTISPVVYLTPDIRAASLLLKPLRYNESKTGIKGIFYLLQQNINNNESFFLFEDEKEQKRIPYSQILYFEARNGKIYLRLQNKEYGMYKTIRTLEEELPENFKRCHKSFIVNMAYISKIWYSKNVILLKNDLEIPVSRSYKNIIKEVVKGGK